LRAAAARPPLRAERRRAGAEPLAHVHPRGRLVARAGARAARLDLRRRRRAPAQPRHDLRLARGRRRSLRARPGLMTPERENRTLVCSVLFLDVVNYSALAVGEQVERKRHFNAALLAALEPLGAEERVVVDTGDGAAIAIPGDPEKALFAALGMFDNIGELEVRGGVNLGPVSLVKDINGHANVIGDGINVAQRIMNFAEAGELLVSRSFYDVARLLAAEYASVFQPIGARADKHGRTHEVFSVIPGVRVGRRIAETLARAAARAPGADAPASAPPASRTAVQISDAGPHLIVS